MDNEERNKLIEDNMNLVPFVGWKYFKKYMNLGEEKREDFISEGYIYLCKAAKKYDENLGYTFSTYAVNYIWGSMSRYVKTQIKKDNHKNKQYSLDIKLFETGKTISYGDILMDKNRDIDIRIMEIKECVSRTKIRDIDEIIDMLVAGYTQTAIAKEMGLSTQGLNYRLRKLRKIIKEEYLIS